MPGKMAMYDAAGFRALLAAVIDRAIDDLKGIGPRCPKKETDRAMAFILSDGCEAYCLELGVDYEAVREKAAALYRRIVGNETTGTAIRKRPKRPSNTVRRKNPRQSPGKRNRSTYR